MGDQTALKRSVRIVGLLAGLVVFASPAQANLVRGIEEIVSGVLTVPLSTLGGTFSGPPILGTLVGAVNGVLGGVGLVAHGALELIVSGVSLAKTVAPYVLPFLL